MTKGFTLIELLIFTGIILVMAGSTWYLLDPLELKRREHDASRLGDLATLHQAINKSNEEASISAQIAFCPNGNPSCEGKTIDDDPNRLKVNGEGWVKIDLTRQKNVSIPILPSDPLNQEPFYYEFKSDGEGWEIQTQFESKLYQSKMKGDGGDNDGKYEIGTNLTLIN